METLEIFLDGYPFYIINLTQEDEGSISCKEIVDCMTGVHVKGFRNIQIAGIKGQLQGEGTDIAIVLDMKEKSHVTFLLRLIKTIQVTRKTLSFILENGQEHTFQRSEEKSHT